MPVCLCSAFLIDEVVLAATFKDVNGGDLQDSARRNDHKLAKWVTQNTVSSSGYRNHLLNGGMNVWQRGGGAFSTTGRCTADRWLITSVGSSQSVNRITTTVGDISLFAPIPGIEPQYFWRTTVTSVVGAGNAALVDNRIEGVRTLANQTVTLSFWAKADAVRPIGVDFVQNFGTGGAPSTSVGGIGATKFTLGTTWKRYSLTISLPSILGKTLGSAGNDYLRVRIWFDAGSTFATESAGVGQQSGTFDLWGFQLEAGSIATPFETRPYHLELQMCRRYFQRIGGAIAYDTICPSGWCAAGTTGGVYGTFRAPMRVVPTIQNTLTMANYQLVDSSNVGYNPTAMTMNVLTSSVESFTLDITVGAWTATRFVVLRSNNTLNGYLDFTAEL